jgi:hypothetical protein
MDNSNVVDNPGVPVVAGSDNETIAQMAPQAIAALGGPGTRLANGYNNGQAAIRAQLEQQMGVNELDADKLVKMLIQTNHLQFVGKGEQLPAPPGQANPSSDQAMAVSNADAGDSFAGEGRAAPAATDARGDVSAPPDPAHMAYNPLVNVAAEMAPGNVMAVPTVPNDANVESARREAGTVQMARAFTPAAVGGTAGYHNAGLMIAPGPIDSDDSDAAGEWYLVG